MVCCLSIWKYVQLPLGSGDLLNGHRSQMPWKRTDHNPLFFIIVQKIDSQQTLRVIAYAKVEVQGAFYGLAVPPREILDLIL